MKTLSTIIISLFVISCGPNQAPVSQTSMQKSSTPYYRVWQGWKRDDLSTAKFLKALESFMPLTPKTHAKNGLRGYTVAIPPKQNAAWIPDEFALVTYESKEIYEKAKATPEGQKYGAAHWDLFKKGPSKSKVPTRLHLRQRVQLKADAAYDVLSLPVNWRRGYTTFYMGIRRKGLSQSTYEKGMSRHVEGVKRAFYPMGMTAYIVMLDNRYEIAYQNWKSKAHFEKAMKSKAAKAVMNDGSRYLKNFMFRPAENFRGTTRPNQAINFKW
ncbi:hypothetical protein N9D31_03690 [Oligoflexaceae bacterium]|nr:hypothetical protein [Oligoflexaceae bacterium]